MKNSFSIEEIYRLFEQKKIDFCPNMFICGSSEVARETAALRLASIIEENDLIDYAGVVKSFSIRMPYLYDLKTEAQFLEHFKNSISIATDCYEEFGGLVIVELESEWATQESNIYFQRAIRFLEKQNRIRYIVIFPSSENNSKTEKLRAELSSCGQWLNVSLRSTDADSCMERFKKMIAKYRLEMCDESENALMEVLKHRSEDSIDNYSMIETLAEQVILEKRLSETDSHIVTAKDLTYISGLNNKKVTCIGFANSDGYNRK